MLYAPDLVYIGEPNEIVVELHGKYKYTSYKLTFAWSRIIDRKASKIVFTSTIIACHFDSADKMARVIVNDRTPIQFKIDQGSQFESISFASCQADQRQEFFYNFD